MEPPAEDGVRCPGEPVRVATIGELRAGKLLFLHRLLSTELVGNGVDVACLERISAVHDPGKIHPGWTLQIKWSRAEQVGEAARLDVVPRRTEQPGSDGNQWLPGGSCFGLPLPSSLDAVLSTTATFAAAAPIDIHGEDWIKAARPAGRDLDRIAGRLAGLARSEARHWRRLLRDILLRSFAGIGRARRQADKIRRYSPALVPLSSSLTPAAPPLHAA